MRFDLVIAGGGPAGCAAAISAARGGQRVLLLEKGRLPRHKVCGEFVSPEGAALLAGLLGPDAPLLAAAPRLDRVRLFSDGRVAETRLAPAALSIPRFALDLALLEAARQAGADCRTEVAVLGVEAAGAGFLVRSSAGTFECRRALNATGRWSALSRRPGRGPAGLGLKAHFRERAPRGLLDLYFFPGGYCGVSIVGQDEVNVCALVRGGAATSLDQVLARSPELKRRSADWSPLFKPMATAPVPFGPPRPLQDSVPCAGDAAGFVDPFVGDGISLALTSGAMAGRLLDPQVYAREYARRILPVFRATAALRSLIAAGPLMRQAALAALGLGPFADLAFKLTRARP